MVWCLRWGCLCKMGLLLLWASRLERKRKKKEVVRSNHKIKQESYAAATNTDIYLTTGHGSSHSKPRLLSTCAYVIRASRSPCRI